MAEVKKYLTYITLVLKSRIFLYTFGLYLLLWIPSIFRTMQSIEPAYTLVPEYKTVRVKTLDEHYKNYALELPDYFPSKYIVPENLLELSIVVSSGYKGVYKLEFKNNSYAIRDLVKNNLEILNEDPTYTTLNKKSKVHIIYNKEEEVYVIVI